MFGPRALVGKLLASLDKVSHIVDHVVDLSHSIQEHCQGVGEFNISVLRGLDSTLNDNSVVSEERVDACSPRLVVLDIVSNLVGSISLVALVLLGDIVWILRLEEVGFTVLTIPLKHVTEGVFNSKTIASDVVTIDLETGIAWVLRVHDWTSLAMVSPPQPGIINDHVSTVDREHVSGHHLLSVWSSNSCEDVLHHAWVCLVSSIL